MESSLSIWRILLIFQLLALLVVVCSAYMGVPVVRYKHYDFYVHFLLFGITSYLAYRSSGRKTHVFFDVVVPFWPIVFIFISCFEEGLQAFSDHRTFSWLDMIGNVLGIVSFYLLDRIWIRWISNK